MAYSTINKSSLHQDGKTYLGSASAVTTTGLGFQPDLVWIKDRDNGNNHCLVDAVRGVGKYIESDNDGAEVDNSTNSISAFTSDGFTTGTANPANEQASTTKGFMSWNWKANGAGSANTDGSINSTVSANTTAGFSIVKWTGTGSNATVGHGLGVAPRFIMMKITSNVASWGVYLESMGNDKRLFLDTNGAESGGNWQDTSPTSTVFSVDGGTITGGSGHVEIAYCFADVSGYSKFGSYIGNGNNGDGTFIYLGFKPSYVLIKQTNTTGNWALSDNKRLTNSGNQDGGQGNYIPHMLATNSATAESGFGGGSSNKIDYLSNGFKMRDNGAYGNTSGGTYLYMAFGQPIISNSGVVATAR